MSVTQLCERKNSSFWCCVAICRLIACTARVDKPSFSRHALSRLPASAFTLLRSMGGHPTPGVNQCPATLPSQLYRTPCPHGNNTLEWSEMRPVARFVPSLDPILAICPRMDFPRNRQAERVRQILSTRGLTFYRASALSAQMFGRSSPFYLPRNLYHRLAVSAVAPG